MRSVKIGDGHDRTNDYHRRRLRRTSIVTKMLLVNRAPLQDAPRHSVAGKPLYRPSVATAMSGL